MEVGANSNEIYKDKIFAKVLLSRHAALPNLREIKRYVPRFMLTGTE